MPTYRGPVIDCDIHQTMQSYKDLAPYLDEPWKRRLLEGGMGTPFSGYYSHVGLMRKDARTPDGAEAGSDPNFMRAQLLDAYNIEVGILNGGGILAVSLMTDFDYAAALASAYNDWLIDTWLGAWNNDGRFKGSMVIAASDPILAAKEIDRVGSHPEIVQVIMASGARMPFGQRHYHPIYEAAERNGLPMSIHPGTEGAGIANPPTAAGYPSRYIEWHTNLPQNYMAHIVSLVTEGVFEKFPGLKFVCIEGGLAWLPALMWRLDKNYKALRQSVPWLKKMPSEYIRSNIRLTTQPIEEPGNDKDLLQIFRMMDAEQIVLFSSDYPHWDFDSPFDALPPMPETMARRIFYENARELYGAKLIPRKRQLATI